MKKQNHSETTWIAILVAALLMTVLLAMTPRAQWSCPVAYTGSGRIGHSCDEPKAPFSCGWVSDERHRIQYGAPWDHGHDYQCIW